MKTVNSEYGYFNIKGYVKAVIDDIHEKEGRVFRLNRPEEVKYLMEFLNNPAYTTFKSGRDSRTGKYFWNEQRVDCIPSNLGMGHGFISYFRCNGCNRRVKTLYEYSTLKSPLCRICLDLDYDVPSGKARELSRILRKPYFSISDKRTIIEKMGITREDIPTFVICRPTSVDKPLVSH
jgi:hypothetical protein